MRAFNELKVLALDYLKDMGPVTSRMIATELDLDIKNTQMLMLRLRRQQLVEMDYLPKIGPGRKQHVYTINSRGLGRLTYLTKKP